MQSVLQLASRPGLPVEKPHFPKGRKVLVQRASPSMDFGTRVLQHGVCIDVWVRNQQSSAWNSCTLFWVCTEAWVGVRDPPKKKGELVAPLSSALSGLSSDLSGYEKFTLALAPSSLNARMHVIRSLTWMLGREVV